MAYEEHWKATPRSDASPLAEDSKDLFNLIIKVVMPDEVKHGLCRQSEIGRMLFDVFVSMKKQRLNTWNGSGKSIRFI